MPDMLKLFKDSLYGVLSDYPNHRFVAERDLVWTVQKQLQDVLCKGPYSVYNDYPVKRSNGNRQFSVDLVIIDNKIKRDQILDNQESLELAVEFKFEPSKKRNNDICVHKLPVVFWSGIEEDIRRMEMFTTEKRTKCGVSVFIDESGRYSHDAKRYTADGRSQWVALGSYNTDFLDVHMLWTEFPSANK